MWYQHGLRGDCKESQQIFAFCSLALLKLESSTSNRCYAIGEDEDRNEQLGKLSIYERKDRGYKEQRDVKGYNSGDSIAGTLDMGGMRWVAKTKMLL